VWEVDLSAAPTPTRRTFLRVHANDARRRLPAPLANPQATAPWTWYASPDIRVRRAPPAAAGEVPPAPTTLPWVGSARSAYDLWVFQTAFRQMDPLCRPDGKWSAQFAARLIAAPGSPGDRINAARWTAVVTQARVFQNPWEGSEPTEADLHELIVEREVSYNEGPTVVRLPGVDRRRYRIDVLAHRRDLRPTASPGDVRIALVRCPVPRDPAQWETFTVTAAWKKAVVDRLTGVASPGALPAPWTFVEAANPTRPLTSTIDARTPRAVTFEGTFADLTGGCEEPAPGGRGARGGRPGERGRAGRSHGS
jgi:hypothetical protein